MCVPTVQGPASPSPPISRAPSLWHSVDYPLFQQSGITQCFGLSLTVLSRFPMVLPGFSPQSAASRRGMAWLCRIQHEHSVEGVIGSTDCGVLRGLFLYPRCTFQC